MTDADADGRGRLGRWRLVLGGHEADGVTTAEGHSVVLSTADARRDRALEDLYGAKKRRAAGVWARPALALPAGSATSGAISRPRWSR